MNNLVRNIRWLGFEGILINDKPIVYINPYKLAFPEIGDLILFTDNKPEHCSPDDAKWLRKGATIIAGPPDCAERFQGDVRVTTAGESMSVKGAKIEVLALVEGETGGQESGVGLNITFSSGLKVYHPGDSILTPEMKAGMTDVLLIPVKRGSEFRIEEAAEIVNAINPKISVPINWDGKKDSMPMIEEFKKLCNSDIEILKAKP